jgi:ABC-2 type transport system permease protein/oleandomycin transport system permease protein
VSATTDASAFDTVRDHRVPLGILRDTVALARRGLIAYRRVPQLLVFSTIQPVIFVVMFRYVFGGAVSGSLPPGVDYVDYLMPGIFVQTAVFGAIAAAIGIASDMKSGLMERFHALPMARGAVLTGRTTADLCRNAFVVALMMFVGFLVGWRIHTDVFGLIAGYLLVLFFGFAMSWIFATVGLWLGDPETAQAAAFPILAPLVFASSAFVPVSSMPGWLQWFAEHQPVTANASAVRALTFGGPTAEWVVKALAWDIGIFVIFMVISVRLFKKAV